MPCKRVSLHRGFVFQDILREKKNYIWVPFLDPEDIKILSLGAIWNSSKGIGLSRAIRLWGTKDPSIRPRCIGTVRTGIQCPSINQIRKPVCIFKSHYRERTEKVNRVKRDLSVTPCAM